MFALGSKASRGQGLSINTKLQGLVCSLFINFVYFADGIALVSRNKPTRQTGHFVSRICPAWRCEDRQDFAVWPSGSSWNVLPCAAVSLQTLSCLWLLMEQPQLMGGVGQILVTSVTAKWINLRILGCKSCPGGPFPTEEQSINLRVKISQWPRKSGQGKEHFHSCSVELERIQRISWSSWILTDGSRSSQATLLPWLSQFCWNPHNFSRHLCCSAEIPAWSPAENSLVAAHSGPFVCFREDFFLVTFLSKKNDAVQYSQI